MYICGGVQNIDFHPASNFWSQSISMDYVWDLRVCAGFYLKLSIKQFRNIIIKYISFLVGIEYRSACKIEMLHVRICDGKIFRVSDCLHTYKCASTHVMVSVCVAFAPVPLSEIYQRCAKEQLRLRQTQIDRWIGRILLTSWHMLKMHQSCQAKNTTNVSCQESRHDIQSILCSGISGTRYVL